MRRKVRPHAHDRDRATRGAIRSLAIHYGFEQRLQRVPQCLSQCRWPGRWRGRCPRADFFVLLIGRLAACCSRGLGWISSRRWTPGRCACTCARPPATRIEKTQEDFARVERDDPPDRRQRSDRRHARQHRPALQRHQHRAERLGDRRPDGRRNPDLTEEKAHARRAAHGRSAARIAEAISRTCSSSFSRPTSSTRC